MGVVHLIPSGGTMKKAKKIRHKWPKDYFFHIPRSGKPAVCERCGLRMWIERSGLGERTMVAYPGQEPMPYSRVPSCREAR